MQHGRAVAVMVHKDNLLVMFRIRDGRQYYTLPGGHIETNETAEQAVLRELNEETSLEASVERLLYEHKYENGHYQMYFLCKYISGEPKLHDESPERVISAASDSNNFYDPKWLPVLELPHTLLYPLEIRDWLIEDIGHNFSHHQVKIARLKTRDLRQR